MTNVEVQKILDIMQIIFPTFLQEYKEPTGATIKLELWKETLMQYDYKVTEQAIKELAKKTTRYAPEITDVEEKIKSIMQQGKPTLDDLWNMYYKALSRSAYYYEEEFNKLPKILQRYVGVPQNLHDTVANWDAGTSLGVAKGQFFKTMPELVKETKEQEDFLPSTKNLQNNINTNITKNLQNSSNNSRNIGLEGQKRNIQKINRYINLLLNKGDEDNKGDANAQ